MIAPFSFSLSCALAAWLEATSDSMFNPTHPGHRFLILDDRYGSHFTSSETGAIINSINCSCADESEQQSLQPEQLGQPPG
mmetsp:Transcript_9169/g.13686  ORF Transcript_9169/g.13686 Transcript_9169/m.13686 type:complete len:81 (-) Transcript_9169:429-671(-)